MASSNRAQRLSGINPLAYMGVEPLTPPLLVVDNAAPTPNDSNGFFLGSIWVVSVSPYSVWVLVNLAQGIANWIQIYPASGSGAVLQLTTQTGMSPVFPDGSGSIALAGTSSVPGLLTTSGGTNTIDFVIGGAVAAKFLTDDTNTATPALNVLTVHGTSVLTTSSSGSTVDLGFTTNNDLQVIGGVTATDIPTWQTLTSTGMSVAITKVGNTINFEATGMDTGATTFETDVNGPADVLGTTIDIAGGANIITDGMTDNTVTINVGNTTNHAVQVGKGMGSSHYGLTQVGPGTAGQVLLSGGAAADPAYVTPTATGGGNLAVTTNASTLSYGISAPVSLANGGTNATSFATTDGTVYYDGTRLVTTAVGSAGEILTSNGAGMAPTYQVNSGGSFAGTQAFSYYLATSNTVTIPNIPTLNYNMGAGQALVSLFDNTSGDFFPGDGAGTGAFFTAPATGIYQFIWQLLCIRQHSGAGTQTATLQLNMNFIATANQWTNTFPGTSATLTTSGSGFQQLVSWCLTVLAPMSSGDTMEFNVRDSSTASMYTFRGTDMSLGYIGNYISGYRIA